MIATFEWTARKCPENTQIHRRANSAIYSELRTLSISVKKSEMSESPEDYVQRPSTKLSEVVVAKAGVKMEAVFEAVVSTTIQEGVVAEGAVEEGGNV